MLGNSKTNYKILNYFLIASAVQSQVKADYNWLHFPNHHIIIRLFSICLEDVYLTQIFYEWYVYVYVQESWWENDLTFWFLLLINFTIVFIYLYSGNVIARRGTLQLHFLENTSIHWLRVIIEETNLFTWGIGIEAVVSTNTCNIVIPTWEVHSRSYKIPIFMYVKSMREIRA